jgi:hypothetical protein
MKPTGERNFPSIPPALLAEVEAAANEKHSAPGDVVREALELYLTAWRKTLNSTRTTQRKLSPAEAVERLLEQRRDNVLPEGVTIRELMTYGRA